MPKTDHQDQEETATAAPRPWVPFLWIIVASAVAHLWCLGSQFYMDDTRVILENRHIVEGKFWLNPQLAWTELGYLVQHRLFGFSAVGFHAVNWILHTAVACVLFGFGRDFLRESAAVERASEVAWFAAVLFAVHPLASEIPNYVRTQDLAWVTLFSLLACWALLRFLRDGGRPWLLGAALGIGGATFSKGPGLFHALMMTGAVGLTFMTAAHWQMIRHRRGWLAGGVLLGLGALWMTGILAKLLAATGSWGEPRFIGHGYTLARVFWEFAWRAVIPVALSAGHQIAETLVPPGAGWLNIPDHGAMWAAAAMGILTLFCLVLAWRKSTRLAGVCGFLFVATMWFRMLYVIPEFMPEYRIYPGMPWFCLGAAIALGAVWRFIPGRISARVPAVLLLLVFAVMSAKRSFLWHDLDRLMADTLRQYPAQARAVWELHDRDIAAGQWQKVIDRQRKDWPHVFNRFMEENGRLAPGRELPTGHFAMADVACAGHYALALAHVAGPAAGMAELRRLETYMRRLGLDPKAHRLHWVYFFTAKARVLEQAGNAQGALDLLRREDLESSSPAIIKRLEEQLRPGS